jgi:hypothetical protein
MHKNTQQIIEEFPRDESDSKAKYLCPCGEQFTILRRLISTVLRDPTVKCRYCGRSASEWELMEGNFEKRQSALADLEQAYREAWKPRTPQEILKIVETHRK